MTTSGRDRDNELTLYEGWDTLARESALSELVDDINKEIAARTKYGQRYELSQRRGWVLEWSNGAAEWYVTRPVQANIHVHLDANEILVEEGKTTIQQVLRSLDPLPLYANSFEARISQ